MGGKQSVPQPVTTEYDAIKRLQKEIDTLNKAIAHKSILCQKEKALMIECMGNGDKQRGIRHMQNKKRLDENITSMTKMVCNLEAQLSAIESTQLNSGVVQAVALATNAMKNNVQDASVVETIMDNAREQIDTAREITAILSSPIDNTDVEDEFNQMMAEHIVAMPQVPTAAPVPTVSTVEEETRVLAEAL